MSGPFYDFEPFTFLKPLRDNWQRVRDEALALADSELLPYPVSSFYRGSWRVFGLRSDGYPGLPQRALAPLLERNRARCPQTAALCAGLPGNCMVGFSFLDPGCEIFMHQHEAGLFICHLGLVTPPGCAIEVRGQERAWRAGEGFVFHETQRHRAWNRGESRRIVLLADFDPRGVAGSSSPSRR